MIRAKRRKSIDEVLEEVEVLIDTHFFNVFSETKSSAFLKKAIENQSSIDVRLFKRTWRTLNCTPKTLKVIREIQENLLCVGKSRELITKKMCFNQGLPNKNKSVHFRRIFIFISAFGKICL